METIKNWFAELYEVLGTQLSIGYQYLPGLFGALLTLTAGWLIARFVCRAVKNLVHPTNRLLSTAFPTGILSKAKLSPRLTAVFAELLFWIIVLLAITVASRIAGFDAISQWLSTITTYVPNLLVAFAILVAGYIISLLVREQFDFRNKSYVRTGTSTSAAEIAQGSVLLIALVLALDQLGVDVTLLIAITVVGAAAASIAFGISFALGVRVYMTNIIGIKTARTQLSIGQRIRIDNVEGQILEMTATQIALDTDEGKILVPGRFIDERITIILTPVANEGSDDA